MNELLSTILFASSTGMQPLWYLALAFALAVIPLALGLCTSFVKISVVLGMMRSALGTQHTPGNLVTLALSLALTGYTMLPVIVKSSERLPSIEYQKIAALSGAELQQLFAPVAEPWLTFIKNNAGKRERQVLAESIRVESESESFAILLPAFLLSELKEAFAMAFAILLPCLVIDLVVANILMGLGMMMVSPTLIALPLKLVLFVATDAWLLITRGILNSYVVSGG